MCVVKCRATVRAHRSSSPPGPKPMSSDTDLPRKKSACDWASAEVAASAALIPAKQATPRSHALDWRGRSFFVIARCLHIPLLHMPFRCRPYSAPTAHEILCARVFDLPKRRAKPVRMARALSVRPRESDAKAGTQGQARRPLQDWLPASAEANGECCFMRRSPPGD